MTIDPADVELLHRLADAADGLTLPAWRTGDFEVTIKDDGTPVTTADEAVEEALLALVAERRPGDGFLGEEVGSHPGRSGRTWVVDGIDGTRNFVGGRPRWSTLIALEVGGVAVAGAVTGPALEQRWATTADGGAAVHRSLGGRPGIESSPVPTPISVSTTADLAAATVAVWPTEPWALELLVERYGDLLDLVGEPRTASSLVGEPIPHGGVPVADGRIDAMVAFSGQAWDHGGPSAVVTAAGGRFSALDGTASFDTGAGVYTNGHLHDALLDLLISR